MSNITITNIDQVSVIYANAQHRDEILAIPGADTVADGTILARRKVATAITAGTFVGTGDGTVTLATVIGGSIVPVVGAYSLVCTEAIADGGVFKLLDPNGAIVATGLTLDVGAGGTTVFEVAGMTFTVTDGAANFVADDAAPLTVAEDGNMVMFATDGVGGAQNPIAVFTMKEGLTVTGASDESIRAMVSGEVRKERLVIDGSAAGVDITDTIIDALRDYSIVAVDVKELNILDNQ